MRHQESSTLIGVDIGGTKCAVVAGDRTGTVIRRVAFPTETSLGFQQTLDRILAAVEEILSTQAHAMTPVFGVACGGPLDPEGGIILSPPNLPGWDNVPICRILEERFGGRAQLMNDANAGALAEWMWGAAQGFDDVVFVTLGTGLGAGLILNGRLHAGRDDLAGELGHWRLADDGPKGHGKAGSFEGFCSGGGLTRMAQSFAERALELGQPVGYCATRDALARVELRAVAEAARVGDALAKEVFNVGARRLGQGLALVIDLLNPEVIVLGGIYGRCLDLLADGVNGTIKQEALPAAVRRCHVVPGKLGESIGDLAALAIAIRAEEKIIRAPSLISVASR